MVPETRYARQGELHLAYQVIGEGPPDILLLDQWFGHVDAQWDVPPVAELRERLAAFGRLIMIDAFAPSVASDERIRRSWARYERSAATPGSTKAIVRLIYESDVRDVLPAIRVPTLVIARSDATGFRAEHGRYIADHITDAKY